MTPTGQVDVLQAEDDHGDEYQDTPQDTPGSDDAGRGDPSGDDAPINPVSSNNEFNVEDSPSVPSEAERRYTEY